VEDASSPLLQSFETNSSGARGLQKIDGAVTSWFQLAMARHMPSMAQMRRCAGCTRADIKSFKAACPPPALPLPFVGGTTARSAGSSPASVQHPAGRGEGDRHRRLACDLNS
jgi:hypothetical protein